MQRPSENWYRNRIISLIEQDYTGSPAFGMIGVEVELVENKRVDILFGEASRDELNRPCLNLHVVEVKRKLANASALLQLMGYMGRLQVTLSRTKWVGLTRVHGLLVAPRVADEVFDAVAFSRATGGNLNAWAVSDQATAIVKDGYASVERQLESHLAREGRFGSELSALMDSRFGDVAEAIIALRLEEGCG